MQLSKSAKRRVLIHEIVHGMRQEGYKLEAIGKAVGRHHSTVMYHLRYECQCMEGEKR